MIKISFLREGKIPITIPLPYFTLHLANSIITRRFIWSRITKYSDEFPSDLISRENLINIRINLIKPMIHQLQNYRGMTIVDIAEKGEPRIVIKL
ncbi:MAG TPA: hypothetical protein VK142_02050 [Bacillota bacterium]|nr:hypothetical protein [Bacillota bacterium]